MSATIKPIWRRLARSARNLGHDCRGIAAVEFAVILPLMLVMFFGTLEFSAAVAVNRKVTIMAKTLANLTAQYPSVADADLTNFFAAGTAVMTPYSTTSLGTTISELWINSSGAARVQWSRGTSPRATSSTVPISSNLIARDASGNVLANQYLIFTEVSSVYTPIFGFVSETRASVTVSRTGINLSDVAYTRPRQTTCVIYPTPAAGTPLPACPQL